MRVIITLLTLLTSFLLKAQLVVTAGRDTTVCAGSPVILGGTPTAHGGTGPYTYRWAPSTGLSCDTFANPVVTTSSTSAYSLTVIDNAGDTARATKHIIVNPLPIVNITASDTLVCSGQQVYLHGNSVVAPVCGLTTGCNGTSTSATVGNGNTLQPGNGVSYPSIFGNYEQSCRQQMLYKANELTQILGGAKTINGVGFIVGQFNSNAYMENFTIRIGCTSSDSLIDWNNTLTTVVNASNVQPAAGWNDFAFNSAFYWDGFSSLIIELCWNNPGLYGNQLNKAFCSNTIFSSYIYSAGAIDQCSATTTAINMYVRPNIRLGYCATTAPVFTYKWKGDSANDTIFTPTTPHTYAKATNSTTYSLSVADNNGCIGKDSVYVAVRPATVTADLHITNVSCPGVSDGVIAGILSGNDTIHYQLLNAAYSATSNSGTTANGDTVRFNNLASGIYHLLLSDSLCANFDKEITVGPSSFGADTNITNPGCPLLNNGIIHAVLNSSGDSINFKLLNFNSTSVLDSGMVADSGIINFTNLVAGTYPLVISDSLCTVSYNIHINTPSLPNYIGNTFTSICWGNSTTYGCINLTGGTGPFNYIWSNPLITGGCPRAVPAGNYTVTVTDANHCTDVISNIIITQDSAIIVRKTAEQPGQSYDQISIIITGGTPPFSVDWGDGGFSQTSDSATHQYMSVATFIGSVQDAIGCWIPDTIVTSFTNGIRSIAASSIKIFPNPAADQLFIESIESPIDAIEVVDVTGKLVIAEKPQDKNQITLDISTLSDGIYLLSALSNGQEYRSRFVKAK